MLKDIEKYCVNYSNFIKIGFGSNGIVYRAINKKNGCYVAIKELNKQNFDNQNDIIQREVKIMKKLKNINSVKLIEVIESNTHYYIVMEYCEYNI